MFLIPDTLERPEGLTDDRIVFLGRKELLICVMSLSFVRYVFESISEPHGDCSVSTAIGYDDEKEMVWAVTRSFKDPRGTHAVCVTQVSAADSVAMCQFLTSALAAQFDPDKPLVLARSVDGVDTVITDDLRPN